MGVLKVVEGDEGVTLGLNCISYRKASLEGDLQHGPH